MIGSVTYPSEYFGRSTLVTTAEDLHKDLSLVILWGGSDVDPRMYGEQNVACYETNYTRDKREYDVVTRAAELKIPILGVCRGAQFLCVHQGGTLWQHVEGHANGEKESHHLELEEPNDAYPDSIPTNSAHHQMMRLSDKAVLLGWTSGVLSPVKISGAGRTVNKTREAEVAWFPEINAIGIQGHPEWLPKQSALTQLTLRLLKEKCNVVL